MTYPDPTPVPARPFPTRRLVVVLGALLAFLVAMAVLLLVFLPKAADRIDSGVQACKYISQGLDPNGKPTASPGAEQGDTDEVFTPKQYKDLREIFAGSRHDDIKAAGTKFVDDAYTGNFMGALGSYANLNGACTAHGYTLPALTASN